jgi:DNA mismatch repair protein MutS
MTTTAPLSIENATPMMRQYLETKARFPDAILFFRLGDFYEMFLDDAVEASQILDIQLTSRGKDDDRIPMCGVPYHAARSYIARLIEAGRKVAICDQVDEGQPLKGGKKLFRREVTRIVTPGTVLDEEILDPRAANYLATVAREGEAYGIAFLDASTGEFRATQVGSLTAVEAELSRFQPREILLGPGVERSSKGLEGSVREAEAPETFEVARAEKLLCRHFGVATLEGFGLGGQRAAIAAAGAALAYLAETQRGNAARHVDRIQVFFPERHLRLDEATSANLELFRTLHGARKKGSLFGTIDKTATAMGGRRLGEWLAAPLLDVEEIRARHDAVEELVERAVLRGELVEALRGVSDLERLLGRLALRVGNARDARSLGLSLGRLAGIAEMLRGCRSALLSAQAPELLGFEDLAADLERALEEELPPTTREGKVFSKGWDPELDELIDLATSGREVLARLEAKEREQTGIASLKLKYNKVFGYYIEVTRPNLHLVPSHYLRKQTTANAERFTTEELQAYEEKILTAEERRIEKEAELFEALRRTILERASAIRRAASAIATVDALAAFARVASEHGYVRPEVDAGDALEIVEGRHPVVERSLGSEAFVPNDVALDRRERQILVITGPNMAGKSTILRQTALIVLLAQAGSFVPAARARIGVADRIFCRVGASDDIAKGQSTFMVEMVETAAILHGATERSLVVLDEIGRGTSTFDGLSIAWAVAEHLHDRVGARTLFATHYHELVELAKERPRVKNATIAVTEQGGRVIFLRKLIPGGASRSYGIEVARLAGVPAEVIARAKEILANLEKNELDPQGRAVFARKGKGAAHPAQLGLFGGETPPDPKASEILDALRRLEPERLSPLEALTLLFDWKKRLDG